MNMPRPSIATLRHCLITALLLLASNVIAERADRNKPVQLEADRMTADEVKQVHVFEGNVVLRQGTLTIRADKLVVRQDAEGFQHGSATGTPATFRVKREGLEEWVEGWAERIEFNERTDVAEFFGNARLKRELDEARGAYISYDGKTEFYRVASSGKDTPGESNGGRVSVVIQPHRKPPPPAPLPAPSSATPAVTPSTAAPITPVPATGGAPATPATSGTVAPGGGSSGAAPAATPPATAAAPSAAPAAAPKNP
jgi:lipopolysaccharide export system protein LptA